MSTRSNSAGNIAYDDLREWLSLAERLGEVRTVKGANCEEDIGLAAEAVLRAENGPCVVFEDIPGCAKGTRLLMNVFAGTRRNMTLGFPGRTDQMGAERRLSRSLPAAAAHHPARDRRRRPGHGKRHDGRRCRRRRNFPRRNGTRRTAASISAPAPIRSPAIPEENWLNAGAYRAQVHDKKTVGMVMAAGHHGRIHRDKSFKRGEPLPCVTVLGGDPIAFFFGGLEAPYGVFELDLVGGLRGKPIKMVRGKVTGLPFPANAEIVLEGFVPPDRTHPEGPFGEWTGHYAGGVRDIPVLDIKAIYHRNDPIVLGVPPMGGGPDEMARYRAVMRSATIKQNITNAGVPGVQQVWCHEVGGARMFHAVSITQRYPGHAVQVAHVAAQCGASAYASKYIVVVDEDIDVTNLDQLLWAMLTRTDPKESIQFITGAWDSSADPALPPERRAAGDMTHSVALINACKPWRWRDKFPADQRAQRGSDEEGAGEIRLADGRQRAGVTSEFVVPAQAGTRASTPYRSALS